MTNIYKKAIQQIERGIPVVVETRIDGEDGSVAESLQKTLSDIIMEKDLDSSRCIKVDMMKEGSKTIFREPVFPAERLIIMGAGHVARFVCEFAAKIGFLVTVCDDRMVFANRERFPLAEDVICDDFQSVLKGLNITNYDYVVILTRGHIYDADCLRELLSGTFPSYLGLIGSRKRVKGLMEMLCEEGYSREKMNKICSPVGLDIGAVTPEEIAIAIVAELIAYRRKTERYHTGSKLYSDSDVEIDVIRYLAQSTEAKAIVTVCETKGSSPRRAGAKMVINENGLAIGSIGGGYAEAVISKEAASMIGSGSYKMIEVDMTGERAQKDGMVCGGTMKVLIEDVSVNDK